MKYNESELIKMIQDAAYEVRLQLNSGFLEKVYRNALVLELRSRGLKAEVEVEIPVYYKQYRVGDFRADIIVEDQIILEIKAVSELLPAHSAQLVNYLTATGYDIGVLINYGGAKFGFYPKSRIYKQKTFSRSPV